MEVVIYTSLRSLILFLAGIIFTAIPVFSQEADLILYNGDIITANEAFSIEEMMAVRNGRIVYVGSEDEKWRWQGVNTRVIDLGGRSVLPGFIDVHTHPFLSAVLYDWKSLDPRNFSSADRAIRSLQRHVSDIDEGSWVLAFGWEEKRYREPIQISPDYLDRRISNSHPICIVHQDLSDVTCNTLANKKIRIAEKKATTSVVNGISYIPVSKDESYPIGFAKILPILSVLPFEKNLDTKLSLEKMYSRYNSAGITTIGVAGSFEHILRNARVLDIVEEMAGTNPPQVRFYYYSLPGNEEPRTETVVSRPNFSRKGSMFWTGPDPFTSLITGVNDQENGLGARRNAFVESLSTGEAVAVNLNSPGGVNECIEAIKEVFGSKKSSPSKIGLNNVQSLTGSHLRHLSSLSPSVGVNISELYYFGDHYRERWEAKENERYYPLKSLIEEGINVSLLNNSPVITPQPLLSVRSAVTRKTTRGVTIHPEEALTIEQALRAITIYPAIQLGVSDELGTLEEGKRADFVILEENPLEVNSNLIHRIQLTATFVNGLKVF